MIKIYLDTNFLLIPAQFKVDIYSEIERICDFPYSLAVLGNSIGELEKIRAQQKTKHSLAAKLALKIVEQKAKQKSLNITPFFKGNEVDDILVGLAGKDAIIATQDRELKKRVMEKGGRVIVLKSKKHLAII